MPPSAVPKPSGSGVGELDIVATGLQSRGNLKTGEPRTAGPQTSASRNGTAGPRTSGSVNGTPWRARQHREIEALIKSLPENIVCICEICDCGKCVHSHTCDKGKKVSHSNHEAFPTTHTHDMFQAHKQRPRSIIRPPPTPREENIPAMLLQTNQRTDFIPREISMRKPASPPKPNYERPTAPLDGISYYTQEFQAKELPHNPLVPARAGQIKKSDAKFYDATTTKDHYKQWKPVVSRRAEEVPCFTGELLYPDKDRLPISTTQQAFPGIFASRPEPARAAPNNLTLDGAHNFFTTTKDVYRGAHGTPAKKCVHQSQPVAKKGAASIGKSQTTHDFPAKRIEKVLPVDPAQPTIDLTFDNNYSFSTEQRSIFKGHDARQHPVPKSFKRTPPVYEKPAVPVDGTTVTMTEYIAKDLGEAYVPLKPAPKDNLIKDLPKFDDRTMNKDFFKNWGNQLPPRLTHADFADHYKPSSAQFESQTTTKATFSTPLYACLLRLEGILNCIETMENILFKEEPIGSEPLASHLVERVSTEFNQLQFYVSKCKGLPLIEKIKPRINNITQVLQQNLEGMFVNGVESGNAELLTRCLRTYITIDKVTDAESLFRTTVVQPYVDQCITDCNLRTEEGSLIMYDKILEFPQRKCTVINNVIKAKSGEEPLKGYDFMINAVWPQIVDSLSSRAPSIFAPGNPDKFFIEYQRSMGFLTQFEEHCGTVQSVERLRSHPSYHEFMHKWSLPIYFQIRLQEIAGELEKCFDSAWVKATDDEFKLQLTQTVLTCIRHCWADGVFIRTLAHRFWKLTLQCLSRFCLWLQALANGEVAIETVIEKPTPMHSLRVDTMRAEGRSSPATGSTRSESPTSSIGVESREPSTDELVIVIADTYLLMTKVLLCFESRILKVIDTNEVQSEQLRSSLKQCCNELNVSANALGDRVCMYVCTETAGFLKQVTDIPRLYRRTNREVPTKPSNYIQSSVQNLLTFQQKYSSSLPVAPFRKLMEAIIIKLCILYEETTSEVLMSVKKMEDSLKRLKRGKVSTSASGISDDNKIRMQISVDVKFLGENIVALGFDEAGIESYCKLVQVVQEALSADDHVTDVM